MADKSQTTALINNRNNIPEMVNYIKKLENFKELGATQLALNS